MDNKKTFDIEHVIVLALVSIFPVLVFVAGVGLIKEGMLITTSLVVSYFVFPVIAVLLFVVVLIKAKKDWLKGVLCVFVLVVFGISVLTCRLFQAYEIINKYENEELKTKYSEITNELMPSLNEISNPQKLEYYHYVSNFYIFEADAKTLICEYDDITYSQQKAELEKKYVFQTDSIIDDENNCEPSAEIDGYSFRMISVDEYANHYPKEVVLVATNDGENEIVYMCFCDDDLDYIDSLDEFIIDDCGWEHIR